jgi:hypothetical protein
MNALVSSVYSGITYWLLIVAVVMSGKLITALMRNKNPYMRRVFIYFLIISVAGSLNMIVTGGEILSESNQNTSLLTLILDLVLFSFIGYTLWYARKDMKKPLVALVIVSSLVLLATDFITMFSLNTAAILVSIAGISCAVMGLYFSLINFMIKNKPVSDTKGKKGRL